MNLDLLPEDCFAHILSFASAREACRLSIVSETMRSMADSDATWEKFLPIDYEVVLSRLVSPMVYSTKKELFLRLCFPHLIDEGKKVFYIDKETSKKCYILSARELHIEWSNYPLYWSWSTQPLLKSRFAEVAELRTIWWLEIDGTINTKMLSPKTIYFAYLLVKFADRAYGLETHPSQTSIQLNTFKSECKVYLQKGGTKNGDLKKRIDIYNIDGEEEEEEREDDNWFEIELGSFYVNNLEDGEVKMCLKEVKNQHLRGGLLVEGIKLRPKKM